MSVLWSLLFLAVTGAGSALCADVVSAENPLSSVVAYWEKKLPNSPMPPAILEMLTAAPEGAEQELTMKGGNKQTTPIDQLLVWRNHWNSENNKKTAPIDQLLIRRNHWNTENNKKNAPIDQLLVWRNHWNSGNIKKTTPIDQLLVWRNHWKTGNIKKTTPIDQLLVWRNHWKTGNIKKTTPIDQLLVWRNHWKTSNIKKTTPVDQLLVWRNHWNTGKDESKNEEHSPVHDNMSNKLIFAEDALTVGSRVNPAISSSNSRAPLLPYDVAESIPFSSKNFSDIITMFGPKALAMAGDIWTTLDHCENPIMVHGEVQLCVTSVELMIEFAMEALETHDIKAFSSPSVPAEGLAAGTATYKVTAVQPLSMSNKSVACHTLEYPYKVFYCHAVNPTRTYIVKLEKENNGDGDEANKFLEVTAVCHLDTSQFAPYNMPAHVKPGDAPACHFNSRDSMLFTPSAAEDDAIAASQ